MDVEYDPAKRDVTFENRGLDMARAGEVFASPHLTFPDLRFEYTEARFVTVGLLDARMVVLAWTSRGAVTRIISMRKANEREQQKYRPRLD